MKIKKIIIFLKEEGLLPFSDMEVNYIFYLTQDDFQRMVNN